MMMLMRLNMKKKWMLLTYILTSYYGKTQSYKIRIAYIEQKLSVKHSSVTHFRLKGNV